MDPIEHIPMLHPGAEVESLRTELLAAVAAVLDSGQYIIGPNVAAFEKECAAYLGVEHAVGLNSGTDALVIALRTLGVGPGDEVITTPFTFFATAEAVNVVGAVPRFADIHPHTYNIDLESAAALVGPATKALIPVHLFGAPADIDGIQAFANDHGIAVVEDCAQAFGAEHRGRRVGTFGHAGAFSFFPTKNLGGFGDGGLLSTNDERVAERARMLRAHGSKQKYRNEEIGYNSRLDELQAALLRVKLPHVDTNNRRRAELAARYDEALADVSGVTTPQRPAAGTTHVYHQYTIRVLEGRRDAAADALRANGISSMIYYPIPVHRLPVYDGPDTPSLPHTEQASREVLSLPIWPGMPKSVPARVAEVLHSVPSNR